jgi:hypothetical protein
VKQVSKRVEYAEAKKHLAGNREVIASFETTVGDGRLPQRAIRVVFSDLSQLDFVYGSTLSNFRGWNLTTYQK